MDLAAPGNQGLPAHGNRSERLVAAIDHRVDALLQVFLVSGAPGDDLAERNAPGCSPGLRIPDPGAQERSGTLKIGPLDRNAHRHHRWLAPGAQFLEQVRIGKDDGLAVYP